MTRKGLIEEAAKEYADTRTSDKDIAYLTFVKAAEWSLARCCEWIEDNIFDFPWYDLDKTMSVKDITNELRKTMEK